MTTTAAVALGKEVTNTFSYVLSLIYNEGEAGEQRLTLTELWTKQLPLDIVETQTNNLRKYAFATQAYDGGSEDGLITLSMSLICKSFDNRYIQKQLRQIREFFEAAPSRAVNVVWVDSAGDLTAYVARVNQCKLSDLRMSLTNPKLSPPIIVMSLDSLETHINYDEPGDPAASAPTIYGSSRIRASTNNGSAALTVTNSVTGKTLLVIDDQGNLSVRGWIRTELGSDMP